MHEAYIVDAVRTPFGDRGGAFRDTHPQDLAAAPLSALERRGLSPDAVEDVIYGCVTPTGDQGRNVARIAPLVAGWPESVPGVQLNRMCGSGQQAINFAGGMIRAGEGDLFVAGGVEHMTREPIGTDYGSMSETYFERYDDLVHQGESAERIAEEWGFDREAVDSLALESQRRWHSAWEAGHYDDQVVTVETTIDGEAATVETDGHPRPETDLETLRGLPLSFRDGDDEDGVIHPGNASGIVDGAAATVVASDAAVEARDLDPMARIVETAVVGVDPTDMMLTGPIPATEAVLAGTDLTIDDVDLFEVNEAFAPVVLAWLEETGADRERTNVDGGAIAHGHPLGATGAALLGKLVHALQRRDDRYGLCTMCIGFGQGIATLVERVRDE